MSNNKIVLEKNRVLANLSEEERNIVLNILDQYSKEGYSNIYNNLRTEDYEEIPVDINTFLHHPDYLGRGLTDEEGRFTLFEYWEELLKKIYPDPFQPACCNILALTGAIGLGKAQPLDSLVLTDSGFKRMGDINLSDKIYGNDGKLHKLLGIFPQGKKKIYKLTFTDNTSCECCEDHLWTVKIKNQDKYTQTLTTKELLNKKLYRLNSGKYKERLIYIPITNPIEYKHKDLFISPYIMGALLGDGSLSSGNMAITSADKEIIGRISLELNNNYEIVNQSNTLSYRIRKKHLNNKSEKNKYIQEIKKYKLNVTSYYKHIPNDYLFNDIDSRISLLQGLMDTDGTINKTGSTIQFNTISPKLRDDIITLVESLGGSAWYSSTKAGYRKNGIKISCSESFTITMKLPKSINPFYLSRKAKRINEKAISPSRAIESIEYVGDKECQCIYIDSKEHLYLTNHHIVTHNTTMAIALGLYELYRLLCLKNPYTFYGLMPTDLITFAVLNITIDAAEGVAWNKIQSLIQTSKWFLEHGTLSKGTNPEWRPPKGIELIYGSQTRHIIGRAVYWAFLDEVSFQANKNVEEQRRKAKELVNAALRRMQSRFQHGEYNPTILCLASSKRTDQSYMETFIEEKKKQDSGKVLIVDEPQWVVRPDKVTDRWFKVAVGNKFLNSEVLPLNVTDMELSILQNKGYTILEVPYGYWTEFQDDVNDALNEIAGISTTSSNKFINGPRLAAIKIDSYQNLFIKEIIEVGDNDNTQYADFIDLKRVPSEYLVKPLYIHMDLSESGDKTGIAGVWVTGKEQPSPDKPQAKDLKYRLAFSVSIKAPKGHDIDFEKNRNLIYWLKEKGFNIKYITTDTFQSFDTGQMLKKKGFNYEELSVDRVTKINDNKYVCLPYQALRSAIYEKRLEMYQNSFLTNELLNLEKNQNTGKVDHPSNQSKDAADALCGALYCASKYADEYAYRYGEDLELTIGINNKANSFDSDGKQILVNMDEEISKIVSQQLGYDIDTSKPKPIIDSDIMLW